MARRWRRGRSTRNEDGNPIAVNVHVGGRLRKRRLNLGMSQSKLARAIGLTFQQIQKYENGLNEVRASRLYDLAEVLDVPVSFFFDNMTEAPDQPGSGSAAEEETGSGVAQGLMDPRAPRETMELVKAYYSIGDPNVRRQIYEMARALAAEASLTPEVEHVVSAPPPPDVQENNGAGRGR